MLRLEQARGERQPQRVQPDRKERGPAACLVGVVVVVVAIVVVVVVVVVVVIILSA